jgi:hypothetical protein
MHRSNTVIIVWLCVLIIGLNFLVIWFIDARMSYPNVMSSRVDSTPISLPPLPKVDCEPTVDKTQIAERDAVVARLEAEVQRMKGAHVDDARAWKTRAGKFEQELSTLRTVVERAVSLEGSDWQAGKLMLAHALVKEKT